MTPRDPNRDLSERPPMRITIVTVRIVSTSFMSTMLTGVTVEAAPALPARPQILVTTSLAAIPVVGKTSRVATGAASRVSWPTAG